MVGVSISGANESQRELVTISCETQDLTTLPDALLDDATISPLAKLAYWYLKRNDGSVLVSDIAQALRMDRGNPWLLLFELQEAGWVSLGEPAKRQSDGLTLDSRPRRFVVHEVPVVPR